MICMTSESEALPDGCPVCGALPIDWAGGVKPHDFCQPAEQDERGRIVDFLKGEAAKWRRYPSELNEQWNQQDEMRAMECERLAYSVQRGDHLKEPGNG